MVADSDYCIFLNGTQNATRNTVVAGSVNGAGPADSTSNFYSRAFTLAEYSINCDCKIINVVFGVESANKSFTVNLNLYFLAGNYPAGNKTLLSSLPFSVGAAYA